MSQTHSREYRTTSGLKLAGEEAGAPDAPTVVLLHGGGQTRHSWDSEVERLVGDGYHVVAYDARGHGDSQWSPKADYAVRTLASDLATVLATIHSPTALVGASMGGMTSFYLVGQLRPPLVKALVLVDIVPRPAPAGSQRILAFMSAHKEGFVSIEEAADAVAAYYPERPRPADPSGLMRNLRLRPGGRFFWHWDPAILTSSSRAEPPSFLEDMISVSPNVTLPTLLVRGGRSDVVDDAGVAELRQLVPQTEVFDVRGAGHMVAGDDNGTFHEGIGGFLKRHLPAR